MGGKSRKGGTVSKAFIDRLKKSSNISNPSSCCGKNSPVQKGGGTLWGEETEEQKGKKNDDSSESV